MSSRPKKPSLESLRRCTPDLRSLADMRVVTLENGPGRGQRLLLARNAAGLQFEVAVDRGFDICALTYRGINLGWHSPTQLPASPFPHELDDGLGFLRNFDGVIVTCGLDHYGEPAEGPAEHFIYPIRRRVLYPLHGRIAAQSARLIGYGIDESGSGTLWCEAEVRQAAVFGEVLVLRRRIELDVFGRRIRQSDVVLNQGYRPARHGLLYHVNLGYPFLDRSVELIGGFGELKEKFRSAPPVPADDAEELFDLIEPESDSDGRVMVGMRNPALLAGLSLRIEFSKAQLPQVGLWRCWQSGLYAMGIEPCSGLDPGATAHEGKASAPFLAPGASRRYEIALEVTEDG